MSNKLPNFNLHRNLNALKLATGMALAAIVLSGCGKNIKASTASGESQADTDPRVAALDQFRQDITETGRVDVMMGACIAWPNQEDGLTVTLNPGVAKTKDGEDFFVVSGTYKDKSGELKSVLMDGPVTDDPSVLTLAYDPKITQGSPKTLRGELETRDNGQLTYVDQVSGKTIANTVVLQDTPPVVETIESTCTSLQKDKKIPKVLIIDERDLTKEPTV